MSARALLKRFDIVADRSANIPSIRRLVVDLAVRGKLLRTEELDVDVQEMLRRISSKADELALSGAIKKLKPLSKIDNDEVPAAYLAHGTFARLGNIANLQKGLTGIQSSMPGEFPLVATAAERGTCDHFDFDGAAAIIPLVSSTGHGNASINRLHYQDGKFALGTILCAVFPFDEQLVSARFLYEYLTAFKEELLVSKMIGTANVTLTLGKIAEVPVPILAPAVQKRVDELMALCDQLEAAQQERERRRDRLAAASLQRLNQPAADATPEAQREHARFHLHHLPRLTTRPEHIKAMRQTILNFAVHGWLVPQIPNEGKATNKLQGALTSRRASWESEQIAKTNATGKALAKVWQKKYLEPIHEEGLFELPSEWVWASTLEICACVENGNTPSPHEMTDGCGEIPFIKVYNLTKAGELDFTVKPTFITRQVHEQKLQRSRILPGDVLMNIVGPPLGKVSLVTDQFPEWNTNQAVVLFRPSDVLVPKYLTLCLLSDAVLTWITRLAQATVGQSNISVSKSRALPIPLPPLAEQHRIVAKVDELMALCDQLEAQLTTTQTDSCRLLEAVLDAALVPA